jgi:hypothetical protein
MPVKNFLSSEEKQYLQNALKQENRAEIKEGILIFLWENDGKNYQEIRTEVLTTKLSKIFSGEI